MLEELKKEIKERGNLPVHIAAIMDGNGRWARQRNLPRTEGHKAGVEAIRRRIIIGAGEEVLLFQDSREAGMRIERTVNR